MSDTILFKAIEEEKKFLRKRLPETLTIPEFITNNLKYDLFEWQQQALENFLIFQDPQTELDDFPNIKNRPTHLLFNMATGAGKTLMMAALILYYFDKGYRHFLFFVNQNNIIDKTENNFTDSSHAKFLFKEKILHGDDVVPIKKVDTFSRNPNGVEIKFTSIQKLYNDIHTERENQTTLADLHKLKIVMLGDEAHHLNAQTKKGKSAELDWDKEITGQTRPEEIERKGWEHMVLELLLNKSGNPSENVLLEFTATLPENAEVQEKYCDKIITKFDLKDFLSKGYTKSINLVSSTFNKKERVLHALLFAWYRHQIALKYGIANFKPVMLFRSKTIDESKADYREFLQWVQSIQAVDFSFLNSLLSSLKTDENENEQGKTRTEQALAFMREQGLEHSHIADWIRQSYQAHNVIITNSETNKAKTKEQTDETTEKLLNNLEAANNPIRAIFTVDRLTEGWDVLNLFDIVRLYEGQNGGSSNKKSGKAVSATVSEKQLIGRGVRYFPFAFEDKLPNKRKFDENQQHDLRVLEELFYYTHDEKSRYISELKAELRKDGFLPENTDKVLVNIGLKEKFAQDESFKNIRIWVNEKQANLNAKANNADSLKANPQTLSFTVHGSQVLLETQFEVDEKNEKSQQIGKQPTISDPSKSVAEIEKHIFNKALHIKGKKVNSLFHFNRLQTKLNISCRDELQADLLKDWKIEFLGLDSSRDISPDDKLQACLMVLDKVEAHLNQSDKPFIGANEFTSKQLWKIFGKPKQKWVEKSKIKPYVAQEHDWYVMDNFIGNNLEEELITFIANQLDDLQIDYDVKLIRNEEILKLANFDDGEGFMPDFILLLKDKNQSQSHQTYGVLHYQIFIEPKGEHLLKADAWKQEFLNEITQRYGKNGVFQKETINYRLIGLPFFADKQENPKQYDEFKRLFPFGEPKS